MFFHHFLLVFTILFLAKVQADRITTYKEYQVVDIPSTIPRPHLILERPNKQDDNIDVTILVDAEEQLEKLKAEAEEIRHLYHDFKKTAFGSKLNRTTAKSPIKSQSISESPILSSPKKASGDWVRAPMNP